jgi:hypothetical protein
MGRKEEQFKYQWASMIVDFYEKSAIRSESREGALIMGMGPLSAMDMILESSEKVLTSWASNDPSQKKSQTYNFGSGDTKASITLTDGDQKPDCDCEDLLDPDTTFSEEGLTYTSPGLKVTAQTDPIDLWDKLVKELGLEELGLPRDQAREWLKECLNCDLQLNFSWQVQPVNLLGPIAKLLADIDKIIDKFADQLDPTRLLKDLCSFFEGFRPFCPPDILMLLLALKMLLRKYVMFGLDVRLDWTAVVGPLIKLIVDAIASLLEQIVQILVAPLDCMINALKAANSVLKAGIDLARTAEAAGKALDDTFRNPFGTTGEGSPTIPLLAGETYVRPSGYIGFKKGGSLTGDQDPSGFTPYATTELAIPIGVQIGANDTLEKFLLNPNFSATTPLDRLILAIQDIKQFIQNLFGNIIFAIESLNAFASGSLGIQLRNAGAILLILDLIALVRMIAMLISRKTPWPWCDALREDPDLLRNMLSVSYPGANITSTAEGFILKTQSWEGTVAVTPCGDASVNKDLLAQWMKDLEKGMP